MAQRHVFSRAMVAAPKSTARRKVHRPIPRIIRAPRHRGVKVRAGTLRIGARGGAGKCTSPLAFLITVRPGLWPLALAPLRYLTGTGSR